MVYMLKNDGLLSETMIYKTRVLKLVHVKYHAFNVLTWISVRIELDDVSRQLDEARGPTRTHNDHATLPSTEMGGTNEAEGTHGKVGQVHFSDMKICCEMDLYLQESKGLKMFRGRGNISWNHQVWGGCSCNWNLFFWGLWPMADLWWLDNHMYCSFTLSNLSWKVERLKRDDWKTEAS